MASILLDHTCPSIQHPLADPLDKKDDKKKKQNDDNKVPYIVIKENEISLYDFPQVISEGSVNRYPNGNGHKAAAHESDGRYPARSQHDQGDHTESIHKPVKERY